MTKYFIFSTIWFLTSCSENSTQQRETPHQQAVSPTIETKEKVTSPPKKNNSQPIDSVFTPIDTNFTTSTVLLPKGLSAQILFQEKNDKVLVSPNGTETAPAKGNHDMLAFLPDSTTPEKGQLFVSHELRSGNPLLGDGGGATMFTIEKQSGIWKVVSPFFNVDFSTVRDTDRNCGGAVAPNGMIYTCEEHQGYSNSYFYLNGKGHRDTSDVGNLKFYENIGYVVEVDPKTMKATQKIIAMGCYFHEDIEFMDDHKTAYLTDDKEPGVWFKFVADQKDDYSQGQLYAYRQTEDGTSGEWITLPRDTASLFNIRKIAIEKGATLFMRHEWIARKGNKIYIAETGHDHTDWTKPISQGGKPAKHLRDHQHKGNNIYEDVYGRILVFDTQTNEMDVYLEGGKLDATVFSNPDCITLTHQKGKDYLVICEDINKNNKGRVPKYVKKKNHWYNELYFLDIGLKTPSLSDLKRFAVTPMGAEFTGAIFTPDNKTMFLNVQHPHWRNGAPYNRSTTIAIDFP